MAESKTSGYAKRAQIVWLTAIIVIGMAVYVPSLFGKFVRDDNELIIKNPTSQSLSYLPKAFSTYFLYGFRDTQNLYYRPLITISFQVNNSLAYHNPFSCRLTNLLLNLLMGVGVFLLAKALTKEITLAGAAALAFVVMPCHVESVAWISGRTDIIAALFMIASFLVFLRAYAKRPEFDWRLASLSSLLFACALFSKEVAIVLPLLIGIYVLTLGDSMKRDECLKWLAAAVLPLLVYFIARRLAMGTGPDELHMSYYLKTRLSRIGFVYANYLRIMFVPREARSVYDYTRTGAIAPIIVASAWLVPAGLLAVFAWARKRMPLMAFSAGWLFVTLLPVSDIVPMRFVIINEHFAYLPSVAAVMVLGWLFCRIVALRPASLKTLPLIVGMLGAGFIMYCGALTVSGCQAYSSNLNWALWIRANKPKSGFAHISAAGYLLKAGYMKAAAEEFEAAIDVDRDKLPKARIVDCKYKVGRAYLQCQDFKRAARAFAEGTALSPNRRDMWLGLAKAYEALGRDQDAAEAYRRADALGALSAADRADMERVIRSTE